MIFMKEKEERKKKERDEREKRERKEREERDDKKMYHKEELQNLSFKHDKELLQIKIKADDIRCEQIMEHQIKENNKPRLLTCGIIGNGDTKCIGTAAHICISRDDIINEVNNSSYKDHYKPPMIEYIKNNSKDMEYDCIDEKNKHIKKTDKVIDIEMIIDMIDNIKNNKNKLYKDIEEVQVNEEILTIDIEEYKKEVYNTMMIICKLLQSDNLDEREKYYNILDNNYEKFQNIKKEIKTSGRVLTNSIVRYNKEQYKNINNLSRKSMFEHEEYIVEENNLRLCKKTNYNLIDCFTCKTEIRLKKSHRGHIIAKSLGGSCDKNNIRLVCESCNYNMRTTDLISYKNNNIFCKVI
jgi:hypothetical protein